MSGLFDCIQSAIDAGAMSANRGREAQRLFNDLRADYTGRMGADAAAAQAALDTKKILANKTARKRRLTLLRLRTARRNTAQLRQHRTLLNGVPNRAEALRVFISGDEHSGIVGIMPLARTLRGYYHQEMDRVLKTFRRDLIGEPRQKARLAHVVRELFGEDTGDAMAGELAQAARAALNRARRDFNAAGGDVGFLDNYGLPMQHNARALEAAGFEAWRDEIWDRLAWDRIVDRGTEQPFAIAGRTPPRGGRAEILLREIYEGIVSEGWSRREAAFHERGLATANRRSESRVLHFRGGEDWLAYNKAFGSTDPFTTLNNALDGYARDTAAMRVLGPNPKAGLQFLAQIAEKDAQTQPWTQTRQASYAQVTRARRKAFAMLDLHSGAAQVPVGGMTAELLAGTRQLLVAAQLGGAVISAVTDLGFQYLAARKVGMRGNKVITRMFQEVTGDPSAAIRMGLIADRWATVGAAQARYVGEAYSPEITHRIADGVLRASGLSKWTEAGRHAFQIEFMGFMAGEAGKRWDRINPALRLVLERKGFSADDWDVIRSGPIHSESGATFLVPQEQRYRTDIPETRAEDLSFRLMSMIHEQTEFAVPSAGLEGQAMFIDQTRPGTFAGELMRSGFMYKSFGFSVLYNQARRTLGHDSKWSRAGYLATLAGFMTVMGYISLQGKELAKGRDPRPMDSPADLGAAFLQGGGLGIFGDFLMAETNRFGGGFAETLAGPVVGLTSDAFGVGYQAARALTGDASARPGRAAVNLLRYNTPGTGIWWWAQGWQRMVFDNVQRVLDPEAERSWIAAERQRIENYGNAAWYAPGSNLPTRAPDFSNALP